MVSGIKKIMKYAAIVDFFGSIFFVAVVAFSALGYRYLRNSYLQNNVENLRSIIDVIQDNISHHIEAEMQKIQDITKAPEIIEFLQGKNTQKALIDFLQKKIENYEHVSVVMFSPKHEPIFVSNGQLSPYAQQEALQASIQRSLIFCGPSVSDFFLNVARNKHVFFATAVVIANYELIGSIAIELSTDYIMKLMVDYYHKLGETGEIVIGKKMNDHIVALFPTRFNPDAAFNMKLPYVALKSAVAGERGNAIMYDDRKQKTLLVWQYMPLMEWGMDIKISYDEVMQSLILVKILSLFLIIISALGACYCLYRSWRRMKEKRIWDRIVSKTAISLLYILFVVNSMLLIVHADHYYRTEKAHMQREIFKVSLQIAAQQIGRHIITLQTVAQSLAFDMSNETINASVLKNRIENDMRDNADIANIIVASQDNDKWDIQSFGRNTSHEASEAQQDLLKQALAKSSSWSLLIKDGGQGEFDLLYTIPFYVKQDIEHKKAQGVIGIVYPRKAFLDVAYEQIGAGHQIAILDNARKFVYRDTGFVQKSFAIDTNDDTARLETIPHLGWYLGGNIPDTTLLTYNFFLLCMGIILDLCIMLMIAYCLVRHCDAKSTEKRYKILLLYEFLAIILTCLQYFMLQ